MLGLANVAAWERLAEFGAAGRDAFAALKFAPVPVVGAAAGRALGGGCELLMHCDAVQAHTDTYMGLVELGAGLVPGWGGCRELLLRAAAAAPAGGPMPPARQAFEVIATGRVSTSAQEARELGYLRARDRITPNRDRLLADARAFALELADGYAPPEPATAHGRRALGAGHARARRAPARAAQRRGHRLRPAPGRHSAPACSRAATPTPARPCPRRRSRQLEAAAVAGLFRERAARSQRMSHMLETGRPLRN